MFGIGRIDFDLNTPNIVDSEGIWRSSNGLTLKSGSPGTVILRPIVMTMAIKWEGLDVLGSGTFELCMYRPNPLPGGAPIPQSYNLLDQAWELSTTPVFYSQSVFRGLFSKWGGSFQLGLRITRSGTVPAAVRQINYGFHTVGDLIDYTIKYQLSQFLSVPADFLRTIKVNGRSFPIPKGFNPALILNPGAYEVLGSGVDKPLTINGENFELADPVVNLAHHVHFQYKVPIDSNNEHIPQIERVPSAFFRKQESSNLRFLNYSASISLTDTLVRTIQIPYTSDVLLDILVFGDTNADANSVASAISTKIARTGGFWNPGFNTDCLVQLLKSITLHSGNSVGDPASGMLFSNTLKLKLANMPHGVFHTDHERITGFNPEYNFSYEIP